VEIGNWKMAGPVSNLQFPVSFNPLQPVILSAAERTKDFALDFSAKKQQGDPAVAGPPGGNRMTE
jgi:hypothetical protein